MVTDRTPLAPPKSAQELLDLYYLELRCNLLEAAATFDRLDRAADAAEIRSDPRMVNLLSAIDILKSETDNRAERFLNHLSE